MPVLNIRTNAQKCSVYLFFGDETSSITFYSIFLFTQYTCTYVQLSCQQVQSQGYYPGYYGYYGRGFNRGGGGGNLAALRVNQYYQNYYKRYNAIQAIRVLSRTIQGLRFSSLLSIGKHTLFLFHKFFLIISIMSVRGFYIFLIYCFYHFTSLCINFYGLSAFVGVGPRPL